MTELEKAKKYFVKDDGTDYYSEILQMEKSQKIDGLIDCIHDFVKKTNEGEEGITSSQIRNVFAKAKQAKDTKTLKLMRPKLAYVLARQKNNGAKQMIALLDAVIKDTEIDNKEHLKNFQMFFEAVVAYHRYEEETKPKSQNKN